MTFLPRLCLKWNSVFCFFLYESLLLDNTAIHNGNDFTLVLQINAKLFFLVNIYLHSKEKPSSRAQQWHLSKKYTSSWIALYSSSKLGTRSSSTILAAQLAVSLGLPPTKSIIHRIFSIKKLPVVRGHRGHPQLLSMSSCNVARMAISSHILFCSVERTNALYKMRDDRVAEIMLLRRGFLIRSSCFKRNHLHQTMELPAWYISIRQRNEVRLLIKISWYQY